MRDRRSVQVAGKNDGLMFAKDGRAAANDFVFQPRGLLRSLFPLWQLYKQCSRITGVSRVAQILSHW